MKIVAFGASSSKNSINKTLATYAASLVDGAEVDVLDLNDYELPLFSVDREEELGQPALAQAFLAAIGEADALVISYAEHNGSYAATYKNLFDWCSRIRRDVYQGKKTVVLATSPGPGGASRVLKQAIDSLPHFDAKVVASLSIPKFQEAFNLEAGQMRDQRLHAELVSVVSEIS